MLSNLDLVQGQLEAYNDFNLERFCSFYHPQIQVILLTLNEFISTGIDNFKLMYSELFLIPQQKCVLRNRTIRADCIIDDELIMGRP